jgi:hypothetical protein
VKIFTELHRVFDKSFGAVNFFDIFLVAAWKINVFEVKMIWFCFMIVSKQLTVGISSLGQIGHLGYMSSI